MRKKFVIISLITIVLAGFFIQGTPAFAASDTVTDLSSQYNLDSYQSYMTEDGWNFMRSLDASTWMNNGANILFDFNKVIFTTLKLGMEIFGKSSVLSSYVNTFNEYSKALYNTLYDNFGLTLIVIMALYCLYLAIFKSSQRAWKQAASFAAVMVLAFGWNAKGAQYVTWFNNISTEVQASLLNAGSNSVGSTKEDAVTAMNNTLFELAIEEPYLLMNYGTADASKINTSEEPEKAYELLFSGESSKLKYDEVDTILNETSKENEYLQSSKVGWKVVVAGLSPVMTLAIGTPLLVVQFMNFFVEVLALLISAFIGLALFMSLIPRFNQAIWKVLGSLIGVFGIRVLLGLSLLLLTSVIKLVRAVIVTDGIGSYILQVGTICVVIIILWKKKDTILRMMTGGVIASTSGSVGKHIFQPMKEKATSAAKLGIDVASLAALGVPLGSNLLGGLGDLAKEKAQNSYELKHPSDAATDERDETEDDTPTPAPSLVSSDIVTPVPVGEGIGLLSEDEDSDKQVDLLEDISDTLDKQENLAGYQDTESDIDPVLVTDDTVDYQDRTALDAQPDVVLDYSLEDGVLDAQPDVYSAYAMEDGALDEQSDVVLSYSTEDGALDAHEFQDSGGEHPDSQVLEAHVSTPSIYTDYGGEGADSSIQQTATIYDLQGLIQQEAFPIHGSPEMSSAKIIPFDRAPIPTPEEQASFREQLDDLRNS